MQQGADVGGGEEDEDEDEVLEVEVERRGAQLRLLNRRNITGAPCQLPRTCGAAENNKGPGRPLPVAMPVGALNATR